MKPSILFLCTGNSCRSQMAEGLARHHLGDKFDIFSAGIEKHGMNPYAIAVMAEAGLDISHHHSKTVDELPQDTFDYVITVCGHAAEHCPYFPAVKQQIHHGFDDPPKLAEGLSDEAEILQCYSRVRDEIASYIKTLEFSNS